MGPKIDLPAVGTKIPQKNLESRLSAKILQKLLPVPVFGHILVLHPENSRFSQKIYKKNSRHFSRYLRSQLKNSKNFF